MASKWKMKGGQCKIVDSGLYTNNAGLRTDKRNGKVR